MPGSVHTDEYRSMIAKLVEVRRASGVTQVQLAARIDKPQSFVSKIERGERKLDLLEFCRIAVALGLPPAELLKALTGAN